MCSKMSQIDEKIDEFIESKADLIGQDAMRMIRVAQKNVPVNLTELGNSMSNYFEIVLEKLSGNESGKIEFIEKTGKYKITINKKSHSHRQYFAVAHELGHYFLHKDYIQNKKAILEYGDLSHIKDKQERIDLLKMEREAQQFAGELLMPANHFIAFANMGKTISEIAKEFLVSEAAASVRANNLNIFIF
jgi:Zn-dependent peptidase ImmA (M78 family)